MKCTYRPILFVVAFLVLGSGLALAQAPPSTFDLRDVNGQNYVTSIKSQQGGTCWTHGVMAAMEGNLMMTGAWILAGETGEPALAEYHLDWWNGFNKHNNDDTDPPTGGGLTVHEGGDYLVATAYLSRNEGAVRDIDGQSYSTAPLRWDPSYHYYYPRHVEWYTAGADLSNIDTIKYAIMDYGVMGTCLCSSSSYIQNYMHYQPPSTTADPNHAVAIIGWDDNLVTQAPLPGAWLCKNSWGSSWGNSGYFWISYYDKHCCQNATMGAISYQDVEPLQYDITYYHDYHGWRDTLTTATEAFNAFTAQGIAGGVETLKAVSFYVATDNVTYTVKVYDRFDSGQLLDELATQSGTIEYTGFHTVDLDTPVSLVKDDDFYIYLYLSDGGQPYDRTSDVPVLLGSSARVIVESSSELGQSFYFEGGVWKDLYNYNDTANFCMKGLSVEAVALEISFPEGLPEGSYPPGPETPVTLEIKAGFENYVAGTGMLNYRFDPNDPFTSVAITPLGGDLFEVVIPNTRPGDDPEFYFSAQGDGGSTILSPPDAPATLYDFDVCFTETVFDDDFEQDLGWTVQNISIQTGAWERGNPVGTDAQPEDDHSSDGTMCYVTGRLGGSIGDYDVDGGPTILTSPSIDMSAGDGEINFYVWFYHSDNGTQEPLEIQISNNDGATWTDVEDMGHSPMWNPKTYKVSDYVTPTGQMKMRFSAEDNPNDSVVEALVDDFEIVRYVDDAALWADAYEASTSLSTVVTYSMDAGAANAGRKYLLLGSLTGTSPGFTLPGGKVLPINFDAFTNLILANLGSPVFQGFLGTLDGTGQATAVFDTLSPVGPVLIGQTMNFAFLLAPPTGWDFTSNAVWLTFEP